MNKKLKKILRYSYLGNVYPSCGPGWYDLLLNQLKKIDEELYPKYIPRFIKRIWFWLHHKSPYFIRWKISSKWYCHSIIQIKEKYGALRIYDCPSNIYDETEDLSWDTCEICGNNENLGTTQGWITRLCRKCSIKDEREWLEDK